MIGPPREMSLTSLMTRRRVCLACRIAAAPSAPPPARCASRAPVGLVATAYAPRSGWPCTRGRRRRGAAVAPP